MFCFYLWYLWWTLGSLVVNYPYDDEKEGKTRYSQSPDDKVFQQVSRAYSQVNRHCWFILQPCLIFYWVMGNIWTDKRLWLYVKSMETIFEKLTFVTEVIVELWRVCVCRGTLWCTMGTRVRTCTLMNTLRTASPMVHSGTMSLVSLCVSSSFVTHHIHVAIKASFYIWDSGFVLKKV